MISEWHNISYKEFTRRLAKLKKKYPSNTIEITISQDTYTVIINDVSDKENVSERCASCIAHDEVCTHN